MNNNDELIVISTIIPIYNSERTIVSSINSVVSELVNNPYPWELLLVDDGSTDCSVELIEHYISTLGYENIKIIRQTNKGAAEARNAGMRVAKGKFIAFNDSDDIWLTGKIAFQVQYLIAHPSVDMVSGIYGNDKIDKLKRMGLENIITIKDQVLKNYFSPPTVLFRSSILLKSGLFHNHMRYAEEGYFFNNMVFWGKCVLIDKKVAERVLSKDRWGASGLSGNLWRMEKGELFNIVGAYRSGFIKGDLFVWAVTFSVLKFIRRLLIKNLYRKFLLSQSKNNI